MPADGPLLELRDVTKTYVAADGVPPVPVLRGASLAVQPGEALAILGPSGSGKTTILNLIGSLDRPDGGSVLLAGQDLTALSEAALAEVRNRSIGFIFQSHHLLPHLSVLENVLVPALAATGRLTPDAEARARALLDRVGLAQRLEHLPGRLSGGECQRVAVVRALINQPRLLLADEPTGALDRTSASNLAQLLLELNREQGVTLVVVTHSLELARLLERTVEVRDGRLVDSPAAVR